jgi:hypothetical protein
MLPQLFIVAKLWWKSFDTGFAPVLHPGHFRQAFGLRILVTPKSVLRPTRYFAGVGMPHRAKVSSRPSAVLRGSVRNFVFGVQLG